MLKDKKIVLVVSGGIAAYKACDLVSRLKKRGAKVRVVLTKHACEFVPPLTFETLSGNPAYTDAFDRKFEIEHVALAKWADAAVVAPATANIIAKMACGLGDDLATTTLLAMTVPVLVAPAMNTAMWKNAATQANVKTLADRDIRFVGPESGVLACGDTDIGRMSEPEKIADAIEALFAEDDVLVEAIDGLLNKADRAFDAQKVAAALDAMTADERDLTGRRVLVTAGPTVERIDPVRFITNRSTGKMGYAIAEAAAARGAEVVLVSGPVSLDAPEGVQRVSVESSAQLCEAVLENAATADAVIQAAAPADFTPETVAAQKIKKTGGEMVLKLKPTTDIAATLGQRKREGQVLVAFAAETNDVIENARGKLQRKNADLVVANDVTKPGAGFGVDTNIVTLVMKDDAVSLPQLSKRQVADAILDRVKALLGGA